MGVNILKVKEIILKDRGNWRSLFNMKDKINGLGVYELKTNHRHPIVDDILKYFEETKTEK